MKFQVDANGFGLRSWSKHARGQYPGEYLEASSLTKGVKLLTRHSQVGLRYIIRMWLEARTRIPDSVQGALIIIPTSLVLSVPSKSAAAAADLD